MKYYIVDLIEDVVSYTNDEFVAQNFADSEDAFVINTETNEWVLPDNGKQQILEFKYSDEE